MADYGQASIIIGGIVKTKHDSAFLEELCDAGAASVDWDEPNFAPETINDVRRVLGGGCVAVDQRGRLTLFHRDATFAKFWSLEAWLVENGMAFDRYSGVCGDGGPEKASYRRGWSEPHEYVTTVDGDVVMSDKRILQLLEPMRLWTSHPQDLVGNKHIAHKAAALLLKKFNQELGADVLPVPLLHFES
jgi:hypothetical protein